MSGRDERVAQNEVLFRELNERIRSLESRLDVGEAESEDYVCECGRIECTERIHLSTHEYERVRAAPDTFAIVPGHEFPELETVIERDERHFVIRKDPGPASEQARGHDPRSSG